MNIPYAPDITPDPPFGSYVTPLGFASFAVSDYAGDPGAGFFGQCTWWAYHKRPDESWGGFGDAWSWADTAKARGYTVTTTPAPNATVVFEPYVEGALGAGHVAHVEQILPGGWVLISEMNFFWNDGGWGRVDYRYITAGPGVYFIH
jgi:surface antigen